MSENSDEMLKSLLSKDEASFVPIIEDIADWCVCEEDYPEQTPLSPPNKRRRKKNNTFATTGPSLATAAAIGYHKPLSSLNHTRYGYPSINTPDIDDRKANKYQRHRQPLVAYQYGNNSSLDLYYLYGDSLARCGQLREAFDIYAFIASNYSDGCVPLPRLKVLSSMLIDYISSTSATTTKSTRSATAVNANKRSLSSSLPMKSYSTLTKGTETAEAVGTTVTIPLLNTNSSCDRLQDRVRYSKNRRIQRYWKDGGGGISDSGGGCDNFVGNRDGSIGRAEFDNLLCDSDNVGYYDVNDDHPRLSEKPSPNAPVMDGDLDPLLCLVCKDILRCPVTANCGHSFCRECCETDPMCPVCRIKFPTTFIPAAATAVIVSESLSSDVTMTELYASDSNMNTSHRMGFDNALSERGRASSFVLDNINPNSMLRNQSNVVGGVSTGSGANNIVPNNNNSSTNSIKFMPDVLVRRLVEKWWGADLQVKTINERATSFMELNLLDDALKFCNASLDKCPNNFNSLLLRAEVLRRLNHYQSSLADIDQALRKKSLSAKAYYQRSLALCGLNRFEEALVAQGIAISLDDKKLTLSTKELFQHDLAKLLQKLLAQSPKKIHVNSSSISLTPYDIVLENRQRKKQIGLPNYPDGTNTITADPTTDSYILRQGCRKHCRRKSFKNSIGNKKLKQTTQINFFGSTQLDSILERIQQESNKIKESEADGKKQHHIAVNPNLIDASDFDCVLCCRTFWKPVVTPCGHTYCWVCLDRCMDYSPSCPLCMSPLVEQHVNVLQGSSSPVPFILAKRPVTKFLEAAMKRFIPECYEKRFRQEMDLEPSVPVFICTTAFPHVPCPLFVYEPRYRLMVRRAVESGEKQFGIVQPHNGKSRYFDVGTILDIRDCVLLGDGCSILSTIGCKRFRILARNEKDGYETAKVEYIYDEIITEDNVTFISSMHASVLSKAIEWYESLGTELKEEILRSFGEMPAVEENWESIADGPAWAWWIIALLPLNQQLKVDILATTSLEKRLRAIEKTLDCMSGTFKRSQQSCVVVNREGIQACQAVECCQRSSTELSTSTDSHTTNDHSQLML